MFEVVGLLVMPALLGMPLKPALLVASLLGSVAETDLTMPLAWAIHLFAGVVVFPLGYLIFRDVTNLRSWAAAGALWGVLYGCWRRPFWRHSRGEPSCWDSFLIHGLHWPHTFCTR